MAGLFLTPPTGCQSHPGNGAWASGRAACSCAGRVVSASLGAAGWCPGHSTAANRRAVWPAWGSEPRQRLHLEERHVRGLELGLSGVCPIPASCRARDALALRGWCAHRPPRWAGRAAGGRPLRIAGPWSQEARGLPSAASPGRRKSGSSPHPPETRVCTEAFLGSFATPGTA